MATGLKVWDANANLVFDSSTKLTRILLMVSTGLSNGSAAIPSTNNLLIPWVILPTSSSPLNAVVLSKLYISAGRVYWEFPGGVASQAGTILVLGY